MRSISAVVFVFHVACLSVSTTLAHFSFIIPSEDSLSAKIIMAETLDDTESISVRFLGDMTLYQKSRRGDVAVLRTKPIDDKTLQVESRGEGTRVIYGKADLGVMERGSTPHHLIYHPKSIIGNPYDDATRLDDASPIELIPVLASTDGQFRLQLVVSGAPKPESEVTMIFPDGTVEVVVTDQDGMTTSFEASGRYAAWARHWDETPGVLNGKMFQQVRHYATIVLDADGDQSTQSAIDRASDDSGVARWIDLPIATASFGAVASRGWLYLYGGHTAVPHEYHTSSSSGEFWRLDLTEPSDWQSLPGGVSLQGMNLAAVDGLIYRVGGMRSLNEIGEPADNRSIADCAVFDPASMSWRELPDLPVPRSSHDVVAVGRTLYVLGGWQMQHNGPSVWASAMFALDLDQKEPNWERLAQPFHRRALIAAAVDEHIYVMGGFGETNKPSRRVEVYNTVTRKWSEGPDLPGRRINGFAPASCTHDGRLLVSVGDGTLYRLSENRKSWEAVAETTPRIVHRMVPAGARVLVMGGAADGDVINLLESVRLSQPGAGAETTESATASRRRVTSADAGDKHAPHAIASGQTTRVEADAPSEQSPRTTSKSAEKDPIALGQTMCPVMTSKRVNHESPVAVYRGRPVALCCETCLAKWDRNPDSYAAVAQIPQLRGLIVAPRKIEQVYCPVYKDRVVTSDDPSVEYLGKTIHLFNRAAVRRWNDDPKRHADVDVLPQLRNPSKERTIAQSSD